MKFRPCIDIHQGKVKQIVGSSLQDDVKNKNADDVKSLITNFETEKSSEEFAVLYKTHNLKGGHVIILDPGRSNGKSEAAALASVAAFPGGLHVGGGITTENALQYIQAGASHVIISGFMFDVKPDGSVATLSIEKLSQLVETVGKEKIVLDLSCRRAKGGNGAYVVVTNRWQTFTDLEINDKTLNFLAQYCSEFLVHGVDVEGMKMGIEEDLVEILGKKSPIPVTYAGGARSISDLERVNTLGNGKVDLTVGSALDIFGGDLKFSDVLEWHNQQTCAS